MVTEIEAEARPEETLLQPGDSAVAAPPAATPAATSHHLPEDRYLNRELSWLDFNSRVLALAAKVPRARTSTASCDEG